MTTKKHHRNLLGSGSLIGDKVVNQHGDHVGKIEELMISVEDGQVSYAVMSFGGILGIGNKFFAVPWLTLHVDQEKKCFILNVDKERLKAAPGFDKNHWPDMSNEQFTTEITTFYSYEPK